MEKTTVSEYISNWFSWFGLALLGTAVLITFTDPNIILFMTSYNGDKMLLVKLIVFCGLNLTAIGLRMGKGTENC